MSVFDEDIHPADPERHFDWLADGVDLLVDGELSEADRRALLLRLEREPDGWRRCALAFLETQCWKAELGRIAPPAPELAPAGPALRAEPIGQRQNWRQHAAMILTMAASFLIVFVVGMGLRGSWFGGRSQKTVVKTEFPLSSPAAVARTHALPADQAADNWETVSLPSEGQPDALRVRALRRDTLDEDMLKRVPNIIPPELQQAFEQSGHRVVQQREIVPIQMKDGRRLVVPVDHVEIHYVGRPSL